MPADESQQQSPPIVLTEAQQQQLADLAAVRAVDMRKPAMMEEVPFDVTNACVIAAVQALQAYGGRKY